MIIRMECTTDSGRTFGGAIPDIRTRADLKAAIARLATDVERDAADELEQTP